MFETRVTREQQRVLRAKAAIEAYSELSGGGDYSEVLSDLLADLMHYVDYIDLVAVEGQDFDDLIDVAEMNYQAEIEEEL